MLWHYLLNFDSDTLYLVLSLNVSQNLKEKIISGEYIDLAQLLQNPSVNGDKHNLVFLTRSVNVRAKS
jgi:hypothetical protein